VSNEEAAMEQGQDPNVRATAEVPPDNRRGGDVRTLLSPKSVGATSGFMGVATIGPADWISEHYHPYSEEFVYVVRGSIVARLDGEPKAVKAGEGIFIPKEVKHRLMNEGDEEAFIVFHLGPLAPRPDMGHVDTEERWPKEAGSPAGEAS
jgi:putative monooxygenase